jgi:hypothetical protein
MNTNPVYLSRAFVEFGPFSVEEMKNFYSRGLLQEIDHIRPHGGEQWFHVMDWINSQPATETKPAAKKAAPAKKATPAAKKTAPAAKKVAAPAKKAATKTPKPKD